MHWGTNPVNWIKSVTWIYKTPYLLYFLWDLIPLIQLVPWWLNGKDFACNAGATQSTGSIALSWEDP